MRGKRIVRFKSQRLMLQFALGHRSVSTIFVGCLTVLLSNVVLWATGLLANFQFGGFGHGFGFNLDWGHGRVALHLSTFVGPTIRGGGPFNFHTSTASDFVVDGPAILQSTRQIGGHGFAVGRAELAYNSVPDELFVEGVLPCWLVAICLTSVALPIWRRIRREWEAWQETSAGRCAGCGYDLRGNVSGVCPECGRQVGPELSTPSAVPRRTRGVR